jgi:putative cell wall-binding protein
VRRVGGTDRYHTAALLSSETFASRPAVAYVATGENFPDALAGAPAADLDGGPVLLVMRDGIPQVVEDALAALDPQSITVLGGPSVVSDQVVAALQAYAPVGRLAGADRYETAVAVSYRWTSAPLAWVATGENFPDALGAGAAARATPILLTRQAPLPTSAATRLAGLGVGRVHVVGGTGAVSEAALDDVHRAFMP